MCDCKFLYARCEYHHCRERANWSVFMPSNRVAWRREWPHGRFKFMCERCKDFYLAAIAKPLKGIDKPEGAPDDWRPSLMEHIRWGEISISFEERNQQQPASAGTVEPWLIKARGWTPAQVKQVIAMRSLFHQFADKQS